MRAEIAEPQCENLRSSVHFVYHRALRGWHALTNTGYARDLLARAKAHNAGHGAKYTAGRWPVKLVYSEKFRSLRKGAQARACDQTAEPRGKAFVNRERLDPRQSTRKPQSSQRVLTRRD